VKVAATHNGVCALVEDSTCPSKVMCWGDSQLIGAATPKCVDFDSMSTASSKSYSGSSDGLYAIDLSLAWNHGCAVLSNNGVVCWGGDNAGQATGVPTNLAPMARVFSTTYAACALPVGYNARPSCWGQSSNYEGVSSLSFNPVDATQHGYHQCFMSADNSVACVAADSEGVAFPSAWRARPADWVIPTG